MLKEDTKTNMIAKYKDFKLAVLAFNTDNNKVIVANDSFLNLFVSSNITNGKKEDILKKFLGKVGTNTKIQVEGCCYHIDRVRERDYTYLLFSSSRNSTELSFLWLKHDLLNILNPIMGFSDVLLDSETMEPDELELIHKIYQNSKKMYQHMDNLSILQNLGIKKHLVIADEYQVKDFVFELADTLLINENIHYPSAITDNTKRNIAAKIAYHDFRRILEKQILIFLSWQESKRVDFDISIKNDSVNIQILFPNCKVPSNFLDEFILVERFAESCEKIDKLQTVGLNYLLLIQIIMNMHGTVKLKFIKDEFDYLLLSFPISSNDIEKPESKLQGLNTWKKEDKNKHSKLNIPPQQFKKLEELFNNFDGLIILDDWEDFAKKIEAINRPLKNKEIESIIENIRTSIRLFDIVMLKKIHQDGKELFSK